MKCNFEEFTNLVNLLFVCRDSTSILFKSGNTNMAVKLRDAVNRVTDKQEFLREALREVDAKVDKVIDKVDKDE